MMPLFASQAGGAAETTTLAAPGIHFAAV